MTREAARREEIRRLTARLRRENAIARIALVSLSQRDVQRLLQRVVDDVAEALEVEYVELFELLPDGKTLVSRAVVGREPRTLSRAKVNRVQDSLAAQCLVTGEPVVVDDLREGELFRLSRAQRRHGIVSGASVPLHGRSGPYGVLEIGTATRRTLSEEEVDAFLQSAGSLLVPAIERARTEAACRFLAEFAGPLVSSLGLPETLAALARLAVPRLADWCCIDLFKADGTLGDIGLAHLDGKKSGAVKELRRRLRPDRGATAGIVGVHRTGRSEFHLDPGTCFSLGPAHRPAPEELTRRAGFHAAIVVPLTAHGHILGTITFVAADQGRLFDEGDFALAEAFAAHAARAIDSVRLLERRSGQPHLPGAANAKGGLGFLDPELVRERLLPATVKETERLAAVVERVVYLTALESSEAIGSGETCEAVEVVGSGCDRTPGIERRSCSIELERASAIVAASDSSVRRIVTELVDNAVKYSAEGSSITIRLQIRKRRRVLRLTVKDEGVGVPRDEQDRIFDRFYRSGSARSLDGDGVGVGLNICRELIRQLEGRIGLVTGSGGPGATFFVELPLATRPAGESNRRRGAAERARPALAAR